MATCVRTSADGDCNAVAALEDSRACEAASGCVFVPAVPDATTSGERVCVDGGNKVPATISVDDEGAIVYTMNPATGDIIPEFGGHVGYRNDLLGLPEFSEVPVIHTLAPSSENGDSARIQAALDDVSTLPVNEHGFRGAVLLLPGTVSTQVLRNEQPAPPSILFLTFVQNYFYSVPLSSFASQTVLPLSANQYFY